MEKYIIRRTVRNIADKLVPDKYREDYLLWLLADNDSEEKEAALRKVWDSQPSRVSNPFRIWKAAAIAAVLLLPLAVGLWLKGHGQEQHSEPAGIDMISVSVPKGHIQTHVLPDGSIVTINAGSVMTYPRSFGSTREVSLNGEAAFKVTHDPEHPFIVTAGNLGVSVLGTYFNVRSYVGEEPSAVLAEGSVRLFMRDAPEEGTSLSPGEKGQMMPDGRISVRSIDLRREMTWVKGNLEFRNEKLSTIFRELERHYDLEIVCSDDVSLDKEYTISIFNSDSFDSILKILSDASGEELSWTIEKHKVYINVNNHKTNSL